jgi:hypothetical protein
MSCVAEESDTIHALTRIKKSSGLTSLFLTPVDEGCIARYLLVILSCKRIWFPLLPACKLVLFSALTFLLRVVLGMDHNLHALAQRNEGNAVFVKAGNWELVIGEWKAVIESLLADEPRRLALGTQARKDVEQLTWVKREERILKFPSLRWNFLAEKTKYLGELFKFLAEIFEFQGLKFKSHGRNCRFHCWKFEKAS